MGEGFRFAHASSDEFAWDDQVKMNGWYDKPWFMIFRPIDKNVAQKIVKCAIMLVESPHVGYSMDRRYTCWQQIEGHGFDPSYITSQCWCDCSQFVAICLNYAGVPVPAGLYTYTMEGILGSTGQFQIITTNVNSDTGQPGDIYLGGNPGGGTGHTAVCVSNTGDVTASSMPAIQSSKYEYPKYELNDTQLSQLARVFSSALTSEMGVKAVASMAANVLEIESEMKNKYGNDIYKFVMFSDFFKTKTGTASDVNKQAVKSVLVDGDRVLPLFVDRFHYIKSVKRVSNNDQEFNATDKSFYMQDTTIIEVDSKNKFKFWCFPDDSDFAFGYTNEGLRLQWNMYLDHGTTQFADGGLAINWAALKPYILYVDRDTKTKIDYADLMTNHGVLGVMIEGGKGFTIGGFRNPKCYDQARAAMDAKCPFGYVLLATARTTKDANDEMENIRFLVSHYSPQLGVWVDLKLPGSKTRNDAIMEVYQRELIKYGLKNKIGIKCSRSTLDKSISWMKFQEDWRLWLVDPVESVDEVKKLIDPSFFDTDNESGPIRGANNAIFSLGVYNVGSYSGGYTGGTSGNTQAVDLFELGDRCYNESSPDSAACQEWIGIIAEIVRWANRNHRVKASLVIATIIHESGWIHTPSGYSGDGTTLSENNNVMGINDYPELTTEDVAWATYRTSKMFRVSQWSSDGSHIVYGEEKMKTYKCVEDCIEDFIGFMCKKHPEFKGNNNLEAYAGFLQGYTPNPNERTVDIRARTIAKFGLEKYDNMDYDHFNTSSTSGSSSSDSSDPLYSMKAGTILKDSQVTTSNLDAYFKIFDIGDNLFNRIYGKSYKTYCTIPRDKLVYIKVVHYNFNHKKTIGELIVYRGIANDIIYIFKELYKVGYEIDKMHLVDDYNASDDLSIENNNTSAFNYRGAINNGVESTTVLSNHAYGCAIDINPIQNPYLDMDGSGWYIGYDRDWEKYARRASRDHMIVHGDYIYNLFISRGFQWGGDWGPPYGGLNYYDYQHFDKQIYSGG